MDRKQMVEAEEIARILGMHVRNGMDLDGFARKVLPVAVRLQRLRKRKFNGRVTIHFGDGEPRSVEQLATYRIGELEDEDGIAS